MESKRSEEIRSILTFKQSNSILGDVLHIQREKAATTSDHVASSHSEAPVEF